MGKKYDAYAQAARDESDSKARWVVDPTPENEADARQAEAVAVETFKEMLRDPNG